MHPLLGPDRKFTNVFEDLYGIRAPTTGLAAALVEDILGVFLEEREGEYRGGVYFRGMFSEAELILQENFIPFTNTWLSDEFRERSIVLTVSARNETSLDQLKCLFEPAADVTFLSRDSSEALLERARKRATHSTE